MPAFEWSTSVTRDTVQFVTVVKQNTKLQNTKKMKTGESKERKFEKKSKRNRVNCF